MSGPSLKTLVIGCGSIGKRHIENLLTLGMTSVVAFEPHSDRRSEVARQFGIPVFENLENAWASEPDIVFVTAPTGLHIALAQEAAEHGCHLFIEKPIADH